MKRFFLFVLIFGFVLDILAAGTNEKTDSLISVLNRTIQPEKKIPVLLRLSEMYYHTNFEEAYKYANQLNKLVSTHGTFEDQANAALNLGDVFKFNGQFDLAVINYLSSVDLYRKADLDLEMAEALTSIGYIFYHIQEYDQAKQYYYDALYLYDKNNFSKYVIRTNYNLSTCFRKEKKYTEALKYTNKALNLSRKIKDQTSINETYNYIGVIYFEMGEYQLARQNYLNSIKSIDHKENRTLRLSYGYNNIGETYREEGNLSKAYEYFQKALIEKNKLNKPELIASTLLNIGKLHLIKSEYLKAINVLEDAVSKINPRIVNEKLTETIEVMTKAHKMANEKGLDVDLKPLIVYNEILGNQFKLTNEMRKSLVEQHNQYMLQNSFEKQALQANIGQLQNTKLYLIWGAIFVVVVFLVLIFLMNQALKKAQRRSQEMVMALTQMKGVLGKSFQRMAEDDAFTITTKK